jgi:hypothetical protein
VSAIEHKFVAGRPVKTKRRGEKVSLQTEVCSWCGIVKTAEDPPRFRAQQLGSLAFHTRALRCTGKPQFGNGSEACAPLGKMKRTAS